jgi:diaminopimelate epimerase
MSAESLSFLKIVATGNDFIFIDLRDRSLEGMTSLTRAGIASRLAHRQNGVGADGVIFVERQTQASTPLKWDFYNSDGSKAEMCGNATRCMGRWAHAVMNVSSVRFSTVVGDVEVLRDGELFASKLDFLKLHPREVRYQANGEDRIATLIDTGVPHIVVPIASMNDARSRQMDIEALRFHPQAGPRGANVTFLEDIGGGALRTVTFERGVEDFTLSCGTGVLAAAVVGTGVRADAPLEAAREVRVETPGGALDVRFEKDLRVVWLRGPANLIYAGTLAEGILK